MTVSLVKAYAPLVGPARIRAAVAAAIASVAGLPDYRRQLVYVDYRDSLTDGQIDAYLSDSPDYALLDAHLDEWQSEQSYDGAVYLAHELLTEAGLSEDEIDDVDPDSMDELRLTIQWNDTSDTVGDLARNTPAQLFRMPILAGFDYLSLMSDSEYRDAMRAVIGALSGAGLSVTAAYRYAATVLPECGDSVHDGYSLDVIWFGDITTVAGLADGDTLTWTDASVVMLDRINGAGMDAGTVGTLTLTVSDDCRPHLDRTGFGYGWNETAGLSFGYYRAEPRVTKAPDTAADEPAPAIGTDSA